MRSLLVCHHDAALDRYGLARWLASFSDLVGVVVITETRATKLDRIYALLADIPEIVDSEECIYSTTIDLVALYSDRVSKFLPRDMYAGLESGVPYDISGLNQCNYILFLATYVIQIPQYVDMYPMLAVQDNVEILLQSKMDSDEDEVVVAALGRIRR